MTQPLCALLAVLGALGIVVGVTLLAGVPGALIAAGALAVVLAVLLYDPDAAMDGDGVSRVE